MEDLGCTLTLVAHRPRHAPPAWRAYVLSQAVVMVVLHLDQVVTTRLHQRLVVALIVREGQCQGATLEFVLSVRQAISKMSLETPHARNVLATSTKLNQEQPIAYDA